MNSISKVPIVVIVYGGGPAYKWDGKAIADGIGGSEECLIMLAEALRRAGAMVCVYNNCESSFVNGVEYRSIEHMDRSGNGLTGGCDVLISWRDWTLHQQIQNDHALRLHCSHDIPVGCHAPAPGEELREACRHIDKFVFLNPYHRSLHTCIPDEAVAIIPIGIPPYPASTVHPARDLSSVLYFSHPHRGLDVLRSIWPEVHRAVPEATLASFWWQEEFFLPPDEAIGILPMRKLGAGEAAIECHKAGIFGYPCTFEHEISPATCIKAQAGGAYPVYVEQGGMRDVVQWGMRCRDLHNFRNALIVALHRSIAGELMKDREAMMSWATSIYDWDKVAGQYLDLYWSSK